MFEPTSNLSNGESLDDLRAFYTRPPRKWRTLIFNSPGVAVGPIATDGCQRRPSVRRFAVHLAPPRLPPTDEPPIACSTSDAPAKRRKKFAGWTWSLAWRWVNFLRGCSFALRNPHMIARQTLCECSSIIVYVCSKYKILGYIQNHDVGGN